jgi:hypothetical protein
MLLVDGVGARQAGEEIADFLIGHGSIRLHVRGLGLGTSHEAPGSHHDGLALVKAVSVLSVTQVAVAAVGS